MRPPWFRIIAYTAWGAVQSIIFFALVLAAIAWLAGVAQAGSLSNAQLTAIVVAQGKEIKALEKQVKANANDAASTYDCFALADLMTWGIVPGMPAGNFALVEAVGSPKNSFWMPEVNEKCLDRVVAREDGVTTRRIRKA